MDSQAAFEVAVRRLEGFNGLEGYSEIVGNGRPAIEPGIFVRLKGTPAAQAVLHSEIEKLLSDLPLKVYWTAPPSAEPR